MLLLKDLIYAKYLASDNLVDSVGTAHCVTPARTCSCAREDSGTHPLSVNGSSV